ncbi:MAG: hypothetical protein IKN42_07390, partial [Elusimicrobia bacterium]|nr:hypothetical protein [Elusimicrobiota bacterium]
TKDGHVVVPTEDCDCKANPADPRCGGLDCKKTPNDIRCNPPITEPTCIFGHCPVPTEDCCRITDTTCGADNPNMVADKKSCQCVCAAHCASNEEFIPDKCLCKAVDPEAKCKAKYSSPTSCGTAYDVTKYMDVEESKKVGTCVPKSLEYEQTCKKNGGVWDPECCVCKCDTAEQTTEWKQQAGKCGYLNTKSGVSYKKADCNNLCRPIARYSSNEDFQKMGVREYAIAAGHKGSELEQIVAATKMGYDQEGNFKCAGTSSENIGYTKNMDKCFCTIGCINPPTDAEKKRVEDYGYQTWVGIPENYKPGDYACKWKCNETKLN